MDLRKHRIAPRYPTASRSLVLNLWASLLKGSRYRVRDEQGCIIDDESEGEIYVRGDMSSSGTTIGLKQPAARWWSVGFAQGISAITTVTGVSTSTDGRTISFTAAGENLRRWKLKTVSWNCPKSRTLPLSEFRIGFWARIARAFVGPVRAESRQ